MHAAIENVAKVSKSADKFSQEIIDEIMEESLKLKGFEHKNIMGLIGGCAESRPAPYIIMPYMKNGSLLAYLRKEKATLLLPKGTSGEKVRPYTHTHIQLSATPLAVICAYEGTQCWTEAD